MNRFWELVVSSRGMERFYCFPFLFLFWLITPVYQFFSRRNLRRRRERKSGGWKARIISVGNISVGGTGKSPITVWMARKFIEQGKKVVIIHSGYGRKGKEETVIGYGQGREHSAGRIGDEPAMMAGMVPQAGLAVGRDKKWLVSAADEKLAPDVILIDDGYQRLDIEKDVDIAMVNPMILGLDRTRTADRLRRAFPSGILRESVDALGRADALFVVGADDKPAGDRIASAARTFNESATVINWRMYLEGATLDGRRIELGELNKRRPFLFAGIGSYNRLLEMCRKAGIDPAGNHGFGDHMDYDKSDIDMLIDLARETKADCYLTTAKDLVKLTPRAFDRPLYCLDLAVEPDDTVAAAQVIGLESA